MKENYEGKLNIHQGKISGNRYMLLKQADNGLSVPQTSLIFLICELSCYIKLIKSVFSHPRLESVHTVQLAWRHGRNWKNVRQNECVCQERKKNPSFSPSLELQSKWISTFLCAWDSIIEYTAFSYNVYLQINRLLPIQPLTWASDIQTQII